MQTNWEKVQNGTCEYVRLTSTEVVVGSHSGSGHTDNAASVSHQEFLQGSYQQHIRTYLGEKVLQEVIEAVNQAPDYPPFKKKGQKTIRRRAFFENLPKNPQLATWAASEDKISGFRNYGNAGGYRTKVASDTCTLTITQGKGKILQPESGQSFPVKLQGGSADVIEYQDYFYLIRGNCITVISPSGQVVFDSYDTDFDTCQFGTQVRIARIYRLREHIFARYQWLSREYPPGWLEIRLPEGFVSYWEEEG